MACGDFRNELPKGNKCVNVNGKQFHFLRVQVCFSRNVHIDEVTGRHFGRRDEHVNTPNKFKKTLKNFSFQDTTLISHSIEWKNIKYYLKVNNI